MNDPVGKAYQALRDAESRMLKAPFVSDECHELNKAALAEAYAECAKKLNAIADNRELCKIG